MVISANSVAAKWQSAVADLMIAERVSAARMVAVKEIHLLVVARRPVTADLQSAAQWAIAISADRSDQGYSIECLKHRQNTLNLKCNSEALVSELQSFLKIRADRHRFAIL